jgi:phenylpyruvate tautomerase PptA (4-oxalocrotonate tautomerase family)
MPWLELTIPEGAFTKAQKTSVAVDMTKIYCEETDVPARWVHIYFREYAKDSKYTGGEPSNSKVCIFCNLRAGRSITDRQRILRRFSAAISKGFDRPEGELMLGINEMDSSTAMEFGLILPYPGDEAPWFEKNKAVLEGLGAV